jgi:hypothetical protein
MGADRRRAVAPHYRVGDKVWLIRRNIKTDRPSDKLDFKRLGPFVVAAEINPVAYRLRLPPNMRIHDVFHVSLLEPYHGNVIPGRTQEPAPAVTIDGHEEFEVKEILDSRFIRNRLYYLVDWENYDPSERTWEPAANITHALDALRKFHKQYPKKPGPLPIRHRLRGR